MKRTFIAIKIKVNSDFVNSLKKLQIELIKENIKWIDINNFHLTLCFVGNTNSEIVHLISNELNKQLKNYSEFSISLKKLGVFRNFNTPRVLFLGIEINNNLIRIKEDIERILISFGYQFDVREFKPHISIARTKKIIDRDNLIKIFDKYKDEFRFNYMVNSIYFYESILTSQGPIYKEISKIELKNKGN